MIISRLVTVNLRKHQALQTQSTAELVTMLFLLTRQKFPILFFTIAETVMTKFLAMIQMIKSV